MLVVRPHYSRSAEEALLKGHCAPGAGHWCPSTCNYFLWAYDEKTVVDGTFYLKCLL